MDPSTPAEVHKTVARWAYRLVLGRDAENDAAVQRTMALGDARTICRQLALSPEGILRHDTGYPTRGNWQKEPPDDEAALAFHMLRFGRPPTPETLAGIRKRHPTVAALRATFLASPQFTAITEAAGLGFAAAEIEVAGQRYSLRGNRRDPYWQQLVQAGRASGFEDLVRLVRALLPGGGQGAVVVDAGADLGLSSLAMAQGAPGFARLLATEADPGQFMLLQRNIEANLPGRGHAEDAVPDPLDAPRPQWMARGGPAPRRRLDALVAAMGAEGFDLLRLNVGGGEAAALDGAGDMVSRPGVAVHVRVNLFPRLSASGASRRAIREELNGWFAGLAGRFPHAVRLRPGGPPEPLSDAEAQAGFLDDAVSHQLGLADLVLCHDLAWMERWA